ncbi:MAG: hypothetical protein FI699_08315 [SAR202 cluster bacterium]|mgnify:FL=1|nr:hypothetical protein [SAR202 cluster bacterium]
MRFYSLMTINRPPSNLFPSIWLIGKYGRLFALIFVLLLTIRCGGSAPESSRVVFSVESGGGADLFIIKSGDEEAERLTKSPGADQSPYWSANGELIAFISDRNGSAELWIMDPGGKEKRQLAGSSADVTGFRWAPDSTRIALQTKSPSGNLISVLDIESGQITALTAGVEDAHIGDWSPDSEWVVYAVTEGEESAIRRRNPTGVDEITLYEGHAYNPRWSRNGQWIAFNRINEDGSVDLVVMNKDGEDDITVATDVNQSSVHDWSPDSKRLVYLAGSGDAAEIYVVERNGNDTKQLTSNRVADSSPSWSSDGSSILFISSSGISSDVYMMKRDGSGQKRVTTADDPVIGADW